MEEITNLFFIGLNPRWQMYKFLPRGLNIMFSAAGFWDHYSWRSKKFPKGCGLKWLDCGGFNLLNKYEDYPFQVVSYACLIAKLRPHYYATMDYPCEPEINRSCSLENNKDRIRETVNNACELAEYESELRGQLVPVIQGYALDEYISCLKLYDKVGMIREYMAVGSMCRRLSSQELNGLIPEIYYAAKSLGVKRLHFFGLKLSPDLISLSYYIHSRDSAVAMDSYDSDLRTNMNGRRWPKGQAEKEKTFLSFLNRAKSLGLNYLIQE